jgi:hypothetical protein
MKACYAQKALAIISTIERATDSRDITTIIQACQRARHLVAQVADEFDGFGERGDKAMNTLDVMFRRIQDDPDPYGLHGLEVEVKK